MDQWFILALVFSSTTLLLWSFRELTRWYLRLNVLEDKLDYLHKMLMRMEENLFVEAEGPDEEPPKERKLFLLKDR